MIDWQMLVLQLRKDAPLHTISRKLGKSPGWLSQISRGEITEPKFSDAVAILDYAHDNLGPEKLTAFRRMR
jgi:hypothetical protein